MLTKEALLKKSQLYLILDAQVKNYVSLFEILKFAVAGGVDVVQLRDKVGSSREILQFSKEIVQYLKGQIPFIVNDRVDIAIASGADGVHVGQDDLPVNIVRDMFGPDKIIGVSCQTSEHARIAQEEGADYLGFGSIYKTKTKPDRQPKNLNLVQEIVRDIHIPVFYIGGINLFNIEQLSTLGVTRVAVTRAICEASQVAEAVKNFREIL